MSILKDLWPPHKDLCMALGELWASYEVPKRLSGSLGGRLRSRQIRKGPYKNFFSCGPPKAFSASRGRKSLLHENVMQLAADAAAVLKAAILV